MMPPICLMVPVSAGNQKSHGPCAARGLGDPQIWRRSSDANCCYTRAGRALARRTRDQVAQKKPCCACASPLCPLV